MRGIIILYIMDLGFFKLVGALDSFIHHLIKLITLLVIFHLDHDVVRYIDFSFTAMEWCRPQ